ncbi:MAG TPA: dihydrofolate reductase [Flavipsychrobacter sp.]|nr:dihydrofolate reductase [Flavipsychrobacter sp.]
MIISAIVAVSENNAIGRDNTLPWHLPEDLKFFKRTTKGKPMLMGRKTFESLGGVLKDRLHIVVSSQKDLQLPEGVLLANSLSEGLEKLKAAGDEEVFIIGGGQVFSETIDIIERLYITVVHTVIEDAWAFFPDIDHSHWKLVWEEKHEADERHKYAYTFQQFERVSM